MKFAGIKVSNSVNQSGSPKLLKVEKPASPKMDYWKFSAPGRNGSLYRSNRYEDIEIKVVLGFSGTPEARQFAITKVLKEWIGREDKLFLGDRPNLFYIARFFDACTVSDEGAFSTVEVVFIASFCLYELYDDLRDYRVCEMTMKADSIHALVCSTTWQDITSYTVKNIKNGGNFEAQPIFKILGSATRLQIEVNNTQFSLANISGTVMVDCENMNVYTVSNGKKVSILPQFRGTFPVIPVGESTVYISGEALAVEITLDFRNTYIV